MKSTRFLSWTALGAAFFFIRLFAYIFPPATPLHPAHSVNYILTAIVILFASYLLWKRDERGYMIAAGEIILGGGGGFLSLGSLSLRTILLLICLAIYFFQQWRDKKLEELFTKDRLAALIIVLLLLAAALSSCRGYALGHNPALIFSDFLPYLFLLYYFPLRRLVFSENFRQFAARALIVAACGNALFILFSFGGLTSGFFAMQGDYYHWYRDVARGKITAINFSSSPENFFRLTLDEGLIMVPALIYFFFKLLKKNGLYLSAVVSSLIVLSLNLTRIYLLAFLAGLLALWRKEYWRRWLFLAVSSAFVFFASYSALCLLSSRGESAGWEMFGWRLNSIVAPGQEESSLSRLLLLPKIMEKIKSRPWLGQGLGDTIIVWSPVLKKEITTPHFDWGYLEIYAEMGIYGALIWLFFLLLLIRRLSRSPEMTVFLSVLISFLIINATSPALFHVLGVVALSALLAISYKDAKIAVDA